MAGVYIWKYEAGNYFSGIEIVDKIQINNLPKDAFPVFEISTEEIYGIAQYKTGEFDISISIDTGETSNSSVSIYNFFKNAGINYKYLVDVELGSPLGSRVFWGTFTTERTEFDWRERILHVICKPIEQEIQKHLENYKVGTLPGNQTTTLEYFLTGVVFQNITERLHCTTSFQSYGALIGNASVSILNNLFNSGDWVNNLDVWNQFVELLIGAGLNWKISGFGFPTLTMDYPEFIINVFALSQIANSGITPQIIEASNINLFNKEKYLYIPYSKLDLNYFYSAITGTVENGIISDGTAIYNADTFRPTVPSSPFNVYAKPGFINNYTDSNALTYFSETVYPAVIFPFNDFRYVDLPTYSYSHAYQGYSPPLWTRGTLGEEIVLARVLCEPSAHNFEVQSFAMSQYQRYIGGLKRAKRLKVVYGEDSLYDLWDKVTLAEESRTKDYYVSRIENIDLYDKTAEILLIET